MADRVKTSKQKTQKVNKQCSNETTEQKELFMLEEAKKRIKRKKKERHPEGGKGL